MDPGCAGVTLLEGRWRRSQAGGRDRMGRDRQERHAWRPHTHSQAIPNPQPLPLCPTANRQGLAGGACCPRAVSTGHTEDCDLMTSLGVSPSIQAADGVSGWATGPGDSTRSPPPTAGPGWGLLPQLQTRGNSRSDTTFKSVLRSHGHNMHEASGKM